MTVKLPHLKTEHLAADVYSFNFDRTNVDFNFLPGQYVEIKLKVHNADERGDARFFTIASSPTEKTHLTVTARIIKSTYKEALLALQPGDVAEISGPFGNFVFDDNDARAKVFLAGGIGVTPFRSMAMYARDTKYASPITLFASFRVLADTTFFLAFKGIEETLPNFKFIPTITEPDRNDDWPGETGRIDARMIERHVANVANSVYYIVGPQDMVASMVTSVTKMGVARENIKFETFTGY